MRFKCISLLRGCGVGEGLSQEHKGLTRHEKQHDCSPVTCWLPILNEEGRGRLHVCLGFSTSRGSCLGRGQTSSGTAVASRLERQGRVCPWGAEALSSSMGAPCLPLHLECAIRAHRNATVLPPWGPTARGRWKGKGILHCS